MMTGIAHHWFQSAIGGRWCHWQQRCRAQAALRRVVPVLRWSGWHREFIAGFGGARHRSLLEKWFIRTSGIYFLYRLISVADTINKK
jgi:hypothetical protein